LTELSEAASLMLYYKSFNRSFFMQRLFFSLFTGMFILGATMAVAAEPIQKTVEALYKDRAALNGQQVQLKGKVVKANNGIMKRNFLHIQDGTGAAGTNDLTVTSQDTARVGEEVVVTGIVAIDVKFGAGYNYPLLLEKAKVTPVN
jgi:hypothetical protein